MRGGFSRKNLRRLFRAIDTNQDQIIDVDELHVALYHMGLEVSDRLATAQLLREMDASRGQGVTEPEFLEFFGRTSREQLQ